MIDKKKRTPLTTQEKQMLRELATAYSTFKTLSRWLKWIIITIFVIVIEGQRFLTAIDNIFEWVKKLFTRG
ncbi:hypothetical protein [Bartonella sp. DGB1]|uniref:hypothetical protein n=1 Tax=Bartonella sp. DGB1 TaxID=3239807 RepID=UPI003525C5F5